MVEVQRKCLLAWVRDGRGRGVAYQYLGANLRRRHRWVEGGDLGEDQKILGLEQRRRLPGPRRRRGMW